MPKLNTFFGILALIATLGGIVLTPSVYAANVVLRPGQTGEFTVQYSNGGDEELMENAILKIYVGDELNVDINSFTDSFAGGTAYPLSSSLVTVTTNGAWGTVIEYRPLSANNASTPSGSSTPSNINLGLDETGEIVFRASLKSDILDRHQVGDVLNPTIDQEGVYSVLEFSNATGTQPGSIGIQIAAPLNVPDPLNPTISFNPEPAIIGDPLVVNVGNIPDTSDNTVVRSGGSCVITIDSPTPITATGSISSGTCQGSFTEDQTNIPPDTYTATVRDQSNSLIISDSVEFIIGNAETPRSGGISLSIIFAFISGILSVGVYFASKKKKMVVDLR